LSAAELARRVNAGSYTRDYPGIDYGAVPVANRVARLIASLNSGAVKLVYGPGRGYLDTLLTALDIHPSSQVPGLS
jgi:hypothetical protein